MANFRYSKKLLQRVLTALVIGPVCLYLIYLGGVPFYALMGFFLVVSLFEAFHITNRIQPRTLYMPLTFIYILFCFACYALLPNFSPLYPLLLILMIIASDIGAYAFGKTIGGPKMWVAVSPNKTWAGLAGACISPMIVYLIWAYVNNYSDEDVMRYVEVAVFGILIGLAGQAGDLLMSFLKRKAGVKDSGTILPGHGGVLDRIDALMLGAPVFLLSSIMA